MELPHEPPLMPEWMSIPIEKFSHSSSSPSSSSYHWVHESKRDDLFLVFRKVRVQASSTSDQECLVMSISAGGNILEQQDVGKLVDMTRKFDSMLQTMGLNTTKTDAPVQIVVKRPCIAMRYTKDPTKVLRIQVRFKYDQDYEKSLDLFKNLGLPIKDAPQTIATAPAARPSGLSSNSRSDAASQKPTSSLVSMPNAVESSSAFVPKDADRPRSASSETLRPSSAASQIWSHPDRIIRPFSTSSSPSIPISAMPTSASTRAEESLKDAKESSLHVAQMLGHSYHTGPTTGLHGEGFQGQKPQLYNFQVPYQRSIHDSTSPNMDKYDTSALPASSTYVPAVQSYSGHESVHGGDAARSLSTNDSEAGFKLMPSTYISQMQGQDRSQKSDRASLIPSSLVHTTSGANTDRVVSEPRSDVLKLGRTVSSFHPSSSGGICHNSPIGRNHSLPLYSGQDQSLPRPQSVPIAFQLHDADWIPPRRELPFLKDRANSKARRELSGKPESTAAVVEEPALAVSPKPAALKKVAKRVAQRNVKKKPVVQDHDEFVSPSAPIQTNSTSAIAEDECPPASQSSIGLGKAVSTKRPASAMDSEPVGVKRSKMVDGSTQTQTLSGRDHTVSLSAPQDNTGSITQAISRTPPSAPPPDIMNGIDEFVETHKARPAPVDPWQTPRYAEASEEERRAMVNDFICENIENDDFLKLCEDVEDSWRRIGLGF